MNSVVLLAAVLVVTAVASQAAAPHSQTAVARGITKGEFKGWPDALIMTSHDTPAKAVVVPGIGGRVVSYGLRDDNILWLNPDPATGASDPGGYFCSLGPEAANLPPHPAITLGPYAWSAKKQLLSLRSADDKAVGASLEREIMFDPATGELGIVHRLKNVSERDAALSLWPRIQCRPGGFFMAPINKKSRFPAGWAMRTESAGKLGYEATEPKVDGVRVLDGVLVGKTGSGSAKVGADSDGQWLAYVLGRSLFVVNFPYYPSAVYAASGSSVLFTWDSRMTELQPMAAEARLRSKRSADLPMKWSITELPADVKTHEEARALVAKIPASPFQ